MPFDFEEYQAKCDGMSTEQLHREWENYTRQISGGATSTATSVLFAPVTGGVSLVGLGLSAPKIHNARKKREIIEAGLKARGTTHHTRKRDVIAPMAVSGAISGLTLGLAGPAANMIGVVGHGTAHVALDAGGNLLEHQHGKHEKNKADARLQAQYENFKSQYAREQAAAQGKQFPLAGYQPGLQIPGSIQSPQTSSPLSPTGINLPGPPPYQPQGPLQGHQYDPVPVPAAYDTKSQQPVVQYQPTFYAGASVQINTYQPASQQQNFEPAQQINPLQPQPVHSPNQRPENYGHPPEKPPVSSYPSPCPTPLPLYSPSQTTLAQLPPVPLQHRPSLPTTTPSTPHVPIHRMSLPISTPEMPIYELPTHGGRTTPPNAMLSMEEELALLRMKILQMELEKREHVEVIIEGDDDEAEDEDESPKPLEVPETFPVEVYAPEPPRKHQQIKVEEAQKPEAPEPASPKLNVFVDLQQPTPLNLSSKPLQPSSQTAQNKLPYPTSTTPMPQPQQQQQQPQFSAPSAAHQEPVKHGLSITAGISISSNRDSAPSQPPTTNQAQYPPPQAPSVSPQYHQAPTPNQGVISSTQSPPQQPASYETYNPQQQAPSIPISPQQQRQSPQGVPISYTAAPPPPQVSATYQTYNPAQQAPSTPIIHHQQSYPLPPKPPHPLQHQDSGYYSNPPSRQSSTFSVSTVPPTNLNPNQNVVSPPTPSFATLSPQSTGPPQTQQYGHALHSQFGPMPVTYTPSPMSPQTPTQQYFPPPPSNAPPLRKDYFSQNTSSRVPIPNPQFQGYQPAPLPPPAPIYGGPPTQHNYQPHPPPVPVYGAPQGGNNTQGWRWGQPNSGAPGEPNPPPIPGQWHGS